MTTQSKSKSSSMSSEVRLDKWVWAARFCKTRSIAREWIQAGKIQYNGQRSKPSKLVELNAQVKVPAGYDHKVVEVLALSDKRASAAIAQTLYRETDESVAQREKNNQARQLSAFHSPRPAQKPDKKQRRQLIQVKHQDNK